MRTVIRRGGQFCYSLVANLLRYLCQNLWKYCEFDKEFAKIIRVQYFCLTVYSNIYLCSARRPATGSQWKVKARSNICLMFCSVRCSCELISFVSVQFPSALQWQKRMMVGLCSQAWRTSSRVTLCCPQRRFVLISDPLRHFLDAANVCFLVVHAL